jgi:hypothetical protein
MKRNQLIFFLTFFYFISCKIDKKQSEEEIEDLKDFPVVIYPEGIYLFDNENSTWLSNYNFYYIGKVQDTIIINKIIDFSSQPPPLPSKENKNNRTIESEPENPFKKYYIGWMEDRFYKNSRDAKIEIQVDKSTKIPNLFPVMLTNQGTDTVFIGHDRHISLIMEAIDSSGNWKPIQEEFIYFCSVGVGSFILPPNECVLTLAPIFKGNYKTKLRLTLGENHSKTFNGFINYSQFLGKYDELGNYKKEYYQKLDTY